MRHRPNHTCFDFRPNCPGCAFELGQALAKKKSKESATHIWMVVDSENPCDIRRYAFSYKEAVAQLAHAKKDKYKDSWSGGEWVLFKLVRVSRTIKKK